MHVPVLTQELLGILEPKKNENFVDCTLGSGGHTKAILDKTAPAGKVLAIDQDHESIRRAKENLRGQERRVIFVQDNFANLREITRKERFSKVQGIIFDLGYSSDQLEQGGRGLTFSKTEPLDMRYDLENQNSASKIVNYASRHELKRIIHEYGEEKFAEQIADKIIQERSRKHIGTTTELAKLIEGAVPGWYKRGRIHPATKTFQALRIAVNRELENLQKALPQATEVVNKGGKIAVLSFHSLEDRIAKQYFKGEEALEICTKKPIIPSQKEIRANPRSRSAKLRVAKKQ